jgi:hypothetical protein
MKTLFVILALVAGMDLATLAQTKKQPLAMEYPTSLVREEQTVVVDGVTEIWRLEWAAAPAQHCEPTEESLTCPCMGFAYGETGDLSLVRLRDGVEVDRLKLNSLFTESDKPVVQRWPADYDKDFEGSKTEGFPAEATQRASVQLMHLADYDHDGRETEFYLQTEAVPCGKSTGVIVGLSKSNSRLHAFGTASNPDKALYLQKREWEALRDASGPVEVMDWRCGDHAAGTETKLRLHWTSRGIDGAWREFSCDDHDHPGHLTKQRPL